MDKSSKSWRKVPAGQLRQLWLACRSPWGWCFETQLDYSHFFTEGLSRNPMDQVMGKRTQTQSWPQPYRPQEECSDWKYATHRTEDWVMENLYHIYIPPLFTSASQQPPFPLLTPVRLTRSNRGSEQSATAYLILLLTLGSTDNINSN